MEFLISCFKVISLSKYGFIKWTTSKSENDVFKDGIKYSFYTFLDYSQVLLSILVHLRTLYSLESRINFVPNKIKNK